MKYQQNVNDLWYRYLLYVVRIANQLSPQRSTKLPLTNGQCDVLVSRLCCLCIKAAESHVRGHDMMHRSVLIIYDQQFMIATITTDHAWYDATISIDHLWSAVFHGNLAGQLLVNNSHLIGEISFIYFPLSNLDLAFNFPSRLGVMTWCTDQYWSSMISSLW